MANKLRFEEDVLDPHKALELLRETSEGSDWQIRGIQRLELVKHRPERRLTVRYETLARYRGEAGRQRIFYGKLYHGHKGERVFRTLRFLSRSPQAGFILPDPVGYHPHKHFLLMSAIAGTPLQGLLVHKESRLHISTLGRCLASFHRLGHPQPPEEVPLPEHDGLAEASVLEEAAACIAVAPLSPELKSRFREVFSLTYARLREEPTTGRRIIHRDLYPEQVLVDQSLLGLIDLDEVAFGEAELDVGNLAAHLLLNDLQTLGTVTVAPLLARAFTQAYNRYQSLEGSRLSTYSAATLLRLASLHRISTPIRSVLSWPELAHALIAAARYSLETGELGLPSQA